MGESRFVARAPGEKAVGPDSSGRAAVGHEALERRPNVAAEREYAALLNNRAPGPRPVQRAPAPNRTGLADRLKQGAEALSGISLDAVRVHRNSVQPGRLGARAFTQGSDIHVAPGQDGTLPHEAWHVVQQAQGRVLPTTRANGMPINDDPALEQEADRMGEAALSHSGPGAPAPAASLPSVPERAQAAVQRAATIQLMITTDQRRALAVPFLQAAAHLRIGYLSAESNLRNEARDAAGPACAAGTMIVFDGAIRDNFSTGATSVEKDHVYGMAISNAGGVPIQNQAQWRKGWIVYEHVDADATRSAALLAVAGIGANPRQGIADYLNALPGGAAARSAVTRPETAPRAIKAWAEKTGTDLATPMPLGAGQQALHGVDFHPALAADPNNQYATIDPLGELDLSRLDPVSPLFAAFSGFLNLNAAAMPGTMGKDHELRDESVGGARAAAGRAWLAASGINEAAPGLFERDRRPEFVAVTGANVTNIFINANAPTWAAYNANVIHLQNQVQAPALGGGPLVVPAPVPAFAPWQTVQGQGPANVQAFVQGFTQPRPGEFYLFHGTSRANVFSISKTGFDPEFVNYTFPKGYGKTGYGTAFTDQFAKALAYAPPEAVVPGGGGAPIYKHYVLVARVFVGNPYDVGDEARRTRGNLELTESNLNYEEARGNKMRAQGQGMPLLGRSSDTVRGRLDAGQHLHSTFQHRNFDLTLAAGGGNPAQPLPQYRDTSVTVSDAIQMYPMFIIEATIPPANVRTGQRR